jgi:hypothetical protein
MVQNKKTAAAARQYPIPAINGTLNKNTLTIRDF